MAKYYAVKNGRKPGIYSSWDECKKQVEKFKGAIYKSFTSLEDAVPQNIALWRTQQERPLVDGKSGNGFDAEQLRLQLLPFVGVRGRKAVEVRPCLARHRDILALIVANRAVFGLFIVSGTAGFTECNHRLSSAIKH